MEGLSLKEIIFAATYLMAITVSGVVCGHFFMRAFVTWAKRPAVKTYKFPFYRLRAPVILLFPTVFYFIATRFYRPEALKTAPFIGVGKSLLVLALAWLATRAVHISADSLTRRFDVSVGDNLQARRMHTQIIIIRRVVNSIIFLVALAAIFLMSGNLRGVGVSLLTSAGVAGIIIGLSAQRLLANLMAGIQLALTQPIRIDDVVVIEGEWGKIEEITLTYIVVHIWDHRRLVVPISYFIEKPIQNWTRTSADLLRTVSFFLDYTVPVEAIRQKLVEILDKSLHWDKKVGNLQVVNCTPQTVRALMSVANASAGWELSCEVREKLLDFIQSAYPEALPKSRASITTRHTTD